MSEVTRNDERFLSASTIAGVSVPIVEGVAMVAHGGVIGGIVALGVSGLIWAVADEMAKNGRGVVLPASSHPSKPKQSGKQGFLYRALNGKDFRDEGEHQGAATPEPEEYNGWNDDVDEVLNLGGNKKYCFSDVLNTGFRPSINKIFLGRLSNGEPVYVAVKDLCHIALAGLTGNGKGNLMRLIMAQLCAIGVKVLMLNPHYMPYDQLGGEDWTPFIAKLAVRPDECADYSEIGKYIEHLVKNELRQRIERARKSQPIGRPYFVVIDELPAVVAHCKDAPTYIGELLREGRKYGIYVILASQDFQVKTIGVDGGGVRKCLKTVFYVGGDQATARALLGEDENGKLVQIPENDLGTGTVMIRCSAVRYPSIAQVPYVDNKAIYKLVGPSTLNEIANDDEPEADMLELEYQKSQQLKVNANAKTVQAPLDSVSKIEAITQLFRDEKINLETFLLMMDSIEVTESEVTRPPEPLRLVPQPEKPALSPELQKTLEIYQSGITGYREVGRELGCGKDKAGELIQELKRRQLVV